MDGFNQVVTRFRTLQGEGFTKKKTTNRGRLRSGGGKVQELTGGCTGAGSGGMFWHVLQNFKISPWWPPNQGEHLDRLLCIFF